jgi:hypothetical protein
MNDTLARLYQLRAEIDTVIRTLEGPVGALLAFDEAPAATPPAAAPAEEPAPAEASPAEAPMAICQRAGCDRPYPAKPGKRYCSPDCQRIVNTIAQAERRRRKAAEPPARSERADLPDVVGNGPLPDLAARPLRYGPRDDERSDRAALAPPPLEGVDLT